MTINISLNKGRPDVPKKEKLNLNNVQRQHFTDETARANIGVNLLVSKRNNDEMKEN